MDVMDLVVLWFRDGRCRWVGGSLNTGSLINRAVRLVDAAASVWPLDGLAGGMLFAWLCVGWNPSAPVSGLRVGSAEGMLVASAFVASSMVTHRMMHLRVLCGWWLPRPS